MAKPKEDWRQSKAFLIGAILIAGPFAIPLIWMNRKIPLPYKVIITFALLGLCWLMLQTSTQLFDNLQTQLSEMKDLGLM
ncbi:MAG: putative membrane protein [Candidatus Omnitrophota bacterium]|jgi:uncharacterized membrane protein